MFKKLMILLVLLLSSIPVLAQDFVTAWVRRYNGPLGYGGDYANGIAVDNSGNIYVTGCSYGGTGTNYDYATIKYNTIGDPAWVRRYNGPANYIDGASAITLDSYNNICVTGYSYGGIGIDYDYTTIKYYPNGDTAWIRRYNGSGNGDDWARGIAVDNSMNVFVTGLSYDSLTYRDYVTIKYDSAGDELWVARYNGPGNSDDIAQAIAVDNSGNVYVTGQSIGSVTGYDYATLKYYPNGDTAWVRRYNGPGNGEDVAYDLAVDGSGNVYVTGWSYGSGTDYDYATLKYYPNGDLAWVRRYDGIDWALDDHAVSMTVDNSGNIYVTGYSRGRWNMDYATLKYYPNGDTAWVRRYNGPDNLDDYASAIAIDNSGNVYVSGYIFCMPHYYTDYATVKYYSNGDMAWVKRYNGPGNGSDSTAAVVVDGSGNVYVAGCSYGSGTDYDYATIKYVPLQQRSDILKITAYSPVDIIVTDPSEDSIGIDFNTIPGAIYDITNDQDKVTIPNPLLGEYLIKVKREPDADTGHYSITIKLDGNEDKPLAQNFPIPPPDQFDTFTYQVIEYLRGDTNMDKKTTVSDVIFLINYLFKGGPPPDPVYLGDVNCDDKTTVSDVVYLINYLFKGGPAPCS